MELNELNQNEELNGKMNISIAGESVEVNDSDNVKETLREILNSKGITSFTILVNGEEVTDTSDLPDTFEDNEIEVKRYVKSGC